MRRRRQARQLVLSLLLFSSVDAQVSASGVSYLEFSRGQSNNSFVLQLDEAISIAVRSNRIIQAAYLQRGSQRFDIYVSEGKFFPKLTLTTGALGGKVNGVLSRSNELAASSTLTLPTGASLSLSASGGRYSGSSSGVTSVTVKQPLLKDGGLSTNTASVRIARLNEKINILALRSTLSQTVVQVIYAYRELIRSQEQRGIAETALRRSRDLYDVNRAMIDAGRMAEVEIFQTEAEVANREVALEEAENQVDASRLALLALLALELRTPFVAVAPKDVVWIDADPGQALEAALSFQPDYQIAKLQLERAQINLEYAKNQQLWDLSLVAESIRSRGSSGGIGVGDVTQVATPKTTNTLAGIQLTVPLGDRSIEQASVHASVDLKTQSLTVLETRQALEQRIRDAGRNIQARWRQLELSKKVMDLSSMKLNAERDKLKVGRSSNFQVLSFENDLRNAENARLNALIAYLNAITDLDERMGKTLDRWGIPIVEPGDNEN